MEIELPAVVYSLVSDYVLGMLMLVFIIVITTGITRAIWLWISGEKIRYNKVNVYRQRIHI